MTCGFQGEAGAFSEEAALVLHEDGIETQGFRTFDELLDALVRGIVERAVLPIENSIAGKIAPAHDALAQRKGLTIESELCYRIDQCLIGVPGASIESIRSASSHPAALQQCRAFFTAHRKIEPVECYDTAGAVAEMMRRGDAGRAAIGAARAAHAYGATVLAREIQDSRENYTRFLLLSSD